MQKLGFMLSINYKKHHLSHCTWDIWKTKGKHVSHPPSHYQPNITIIQKSMHMNIPSAQSVYNIVCASVCRCEIAKTFRKSMHIKWQKAVYFVSTTYIFIRSCVYNNISCPMKMNERRKPHPCFLHHHTHTNTRQYYHAAVVLCSLLRSQKCICRWNGYMNNECGGIEAMR